VVYAVGSFEEHYRAWKKQTPTEISELTIGDNTFVMHIYKFPSKEYRLNPDETVSEIDDE